MILHSACWMALLLAADDRPPPADDLATVATAFARGPKAIVSGVAKVTQRTVGPNGRGAIEIKCDASFADNKERFVFEYSPEAAAHMLDFPRTKLIFLYDGTACMTVAYSDHIAPAGCEAIVDADPKLAESQAGIALVKGMPRIAIWFPRGLGPISADAFEASRRDDGLVQLTSRTVGPKRTQVLADPVAGFNIVRATSTYPKSGTETVREAKWRQRGDVWCVERISHTTSKAGVLEERWELEYTDFKPNVEVDASTFTVASLKLPTNARIVDLRTAEQRNNYSAAPPANDPTLTVARYLEDLAKGVAPK